MKVKTVGDLEFNKETVQGLRESMIELRDGALKQSDFGWAVTLSYVIAALAIMLEELEE